MTHYTGGWDCFHFSPGERESMQCRACGAEMRLERNIDGPTSWAESMMGGSHLHDSFYCPNVVQDWHEQVVKLKVKAEFCSSASLKAILEQEVATILEDNYNKGK